MATEFIERGYRVCGCARTQTEIQKLQLQFPLQDFKILDVSSDEQTREWATHIRQIHGIPDIVINNAAVFERKASFLEVETETFSKEIDINIKGVANVIRHFAPLLATRKRGVFVNFTSRWGVKFEAKMASYCTAKWALVALTRVLAEELRPAGVAAVGLNPGIVKTQMLKKYLGHNIDSDHAQTFPSTTQWARIAVPFIIGLNLKDTGKIRNIPRPSTLQQAK